MNSTNARWDRRRRTDAPCDKLVCGSSARCNVLNRSEGASKARPNNIHTHARIEIPATVCGKLEEAAKNVPRKRRRKVAGGLAGPC